MRLFENNSGKIRNFGRRSEMAHEIFQPVIAVLIPESGMLQKYYQLEFYYFCWFNLVIKASVVRILKLLLPGTHQYIGKNQIPISMFKSPEANIFWLTLEEVFSKGLR